MALNKGDILRKRYLIENIIAQGGMGAVYLAFDQNLNLHVALKENLVVTEDSSRQFHREATLLGGLKHPNLPRVTDHFIIPDQGEYLVMDYIDGADLRESIGSAKPLPVDKVIQIGVTICDALAYLHNHQPPIIHRDIKPGNIKITSTGQIVLVDFGLAKSDIEGQATATGAQSLTPGYAPPEQYGKGTDARSDIYGLGATLYAILTNNIPEDGIARLVGAVDLTPIRKIRPEVPELVSYAIEKAINVEREKRFQRIEAFKAALMGKFYDEPVPTPVQKTPIQQKSIQSFSTPEVDTSTVILSEDKPAKPANKKSPWIWVAILGLIAVLFLFFAGAGLLFLNFAPSLSTPSSLKPTASSASILLTQSGPTSAVTAFPTAPAASVILQPTPAALNTIAPTPAATTAAVMPDLIAFTSERSGNPQIWIMNADGSGAKKITNQPTGACQPAWSPDGKKLVYVSPCSGQKDKYSGSYLFIINMDGSGLSPLPSVPGGDFDPSWSPDGKQIIFTSIRKGFANIYLMTLSDKSTTRITSHTNIVERRPVWSPDGKWVAYQSTQFNQNQIWLVQVGLWDQGKAYTSPNTSDIMPSWSPDGNYLVFSQGTPLPWLATKQLNQPTAPEIRLSDTRPALQPVYTSDGTRLIFVSRVNDKNDIYQFNIASGEIKKLTDDSSADYDPAWRPSKN